MFFFNFIVIGDSPESPDLFPPAQRQRRGPILLDSDEETQEVPFENGQRFFLSDEEFEPPQSPPVNVSPINNGLDYLDRIEEECRNREQKE